MFTLDFKSAKEGFFDRQKVIDAEDKATLRNLKAQGRIVRSTAQKSLVYSKASASPGRPPHAHRTQTVYKKSRKSGRVRKQSVSPLRDKIWFAYDSTSRSVVVGPVKLSGMVSNNAPASLEAGGSSVIMVHGKRRAVTIQPHPFMRPAAVAAIGDVPAIWKDSIR